MVKKQHQQIVKEFLGQEDAKMIHCKNGMTLYLKSNKDKIVVITPNEKDDEWLEEAKRLYMVSGIEPPKISEYKRGKYHVYTFYR